MSKQDLCKQFVHGTYSEDDEFEIVETLVDLRADECTCVFAKEPKPQCKKPSVTPFGLCNAHLKTKTGTNLAIKWNKLLEDLEIEESEEEEDTLQETPQNEKTVTFVDSDQVEIVEPVEQVEQAKVEEPVAPEPVVVKDLAPKKETPSKATTKKEAPKEAAPLKDQAKQTHGETASKKEVVSKKEVKPAVPASPAAPKESESDSGVARYVAQNSEEEVEEEVKVVKPKLRFERNNFGNFINKETKLVIRQRDRVVLGTETETGTIDYLTDEEIEFCKEHNLNYIAKE